eukprot:1155923-Pelagomonas_calceolata.AAC.1
MHDFWHFTTYELQQEGYRITQKWSMYLSKKRNCLCVAGYWRTVTSMPNKLDHFPVPMDTLRKCVSHALQTYLWMLGDGKPKQPMLRNRKGICPMEFRLAGCRRMVGTCGLRTMEWMLVCTRQGASGVSVFNCHFGIIKDHELDVKHRAKEQQQEQQPPASKKPAQSTAESLA